jgi:recombination protein RecA
MARNFAQLRSQVERSLSGRVAAPFEYRDRCATENALTGIDEIDLLTGGFPRGALTEIFGPACSGRTSLLNSALGMRTDQAENCALIDASDAFDPCRAEVAGVDLKQLLWVRCRNFDHALRATDLLLQGGGFSFVCLDLGDVSRETVRKLPLDAWFRLRRAVENTQTILVVIEQESNAKTCASLVLKLEAGRVHWSTTQQAETLQDFSEDSRLQSFAILLDSLDVHAAVLRSRMNPVCRTEFHEGRIASADRSLSGSLETTFRVNTMLGISPTRMSNRKPNSPEI